MPSHIGFGGLKDLPVPGTETAATTKGVPTRVSVPRS